MDKDIDYIGEKNWKYSELGTMTGWEARKYYLWFLEQIDKRIQYLQEYLKENNVNCDLDYSEESLNKLWIWYRGCRRYIKRSEDELEKAKKYYPEKFEKYIPKYKLSNTSAEIAMDIGIYFGETFIHNYKQLKWEYVKTRKN